MYIMDDIAGRHVAIFVWYGELFDIGLALFWEPVVNESHVLALA